MSEYYLDNCVVSAIPDKPGLIQIDGCCPICGKHWKLCLTQNSLEKHIFDNLSPQNRNLLETGKCNGCKVNDV